MILRGAHNTKAFAVKPAGRGNKYSAKAVVFDGMRFHSGSEARRHAELVLLERAGEIRELKRQVPFEMKVNGVVIVTWVVDWLYFEPGLGMVVEDRKSAPVRARRDFKIQERLFRALYPGYTVRLT